MVNWFAYFNLSVVNLERIIELPEEEEEKAWGGIGCLLGPNFLYELIMLVLGWEGRGD